jgi:hypothetical protein
MSKARDSGHLLATVAIFMLSGCSTATPDNKANDTAAVDALNTWWKEWTYSPKPIKAGTVTPAHTITSTNTSGPFAGHVYAIPKHVETKKEAEDEAENAEYMEHKRGLVKGFSVKGDTVTVLTGGNIDIQAGQEICHDLGAFVWANANRRFGLQNIKVTGASGELLSSRIGLSGKVQ